MNQLILGNNLRNHAENGFRNNRPNLSRPAFLLQPQLRSNLGRQRRSPFIRRPMVGGIDHYIAWLKERVAEMHRLLKPTGSIYLHCDWHADAYIRVYILDKIFGENNFRSHITWKRTTAHGNAKQGSKRFEVNFDSIYYYSKSNKYIFTTQYCDFSDEQIKQQYNKIDERGRQYRLVTPTAQNLEGMFHTIFMA